MWQHIMFTLDSLSRTWGVLFKIWRSWVWTPVMSNLEWLVLLSNWYLNKVMLEQKNLYTLSFVVLGEPNIPQPRQICLFHLVQFPWHANHMLDGNTSLVRFLHVVSLFVSNFLTLSHDLLPLVKGIALVRAYSIYTADPDADALPQNDESV